MIRFNRLPALAIVLAGSLAIPAGIASAQSNSSYRSADAIAGKSERLGVYGNVQKDCSSGPCDGACGDPAEAWRAERAQRNPEGGPDHPLPQAGADGTRDLLQSQPQVQGS